MVQVRNGRRGAVFTLRVTDEERLELEDAQSADAGPRALGPWLVWTALRHARGLLRRAPAVALPRNEDPGRDDVRSPGPPLHERLILDLCGGSGSWSRPYAEAGYRVELVTLPDHDVRIYAPPPDVWGILAAPPCDQFSVARNGCESPRDFHRGMEVVSACMRVILSARPRWWALENPVGMLSRWLGVPRDVWEPCDFGDPWTKRTAIWGDFRIPLRGPFVEPVGGGPLCVECDPAARSTTWCNNSVHRARTPAGFARAFHAANP